ncbi:PorP/SprF family type IX secretion system membrane protein [Aureispira sp. CCB-QB1]|uniref:PorP/SprF family type IX secretion system membrane protein n=1 Tax=Aureispira sp. CCB-QB1 TaxID=1313421 RepID=UPI0009DE29C9|nr:PorP/SprF family type IX secretion system membrane protein [Aureispira sp. CCB-QB1]
MMKHIYLFILAILIGPSLSAQDIHWSQFEYAPLNLNAAHTGLFNGDYRLVGNYRSQWFDVPVSYRTVSLTFDAHLLPYQLENDVWGVGLTFNHDQAGDGQLSLLNVMLSTAYTKRITKHFFIGAGVQLGYNNRRYNLQKLTFNDQFNGDVYDPNLVSYDQTKFAGKTNINYFDINAGLNFRYQSSNRMWVNLGGGVFHLTRPNMSFLGVDGILLPIRWNVMANASIQVSQRIDIMPSVIFQRQLNYQEIVYGASLRYHFNVNPGRETSGEIGIMHRWDDAIIARIGFAYQQWHVGLSYDINVSGFEAATRNNGGYELSVVYIWSKVPSLGSVKTCPIF